MIMTKRPVESSSSNLSPQLKKTKSGGAGEPAQDSLSMNIDPVHVDLRTALHIKKALDNIHGLQELGYCPTKVQQFREYFSLDERDELYGRRRTHDDESDGREGEERKGLKSRDLANQVILDELETVYEDMKSLSTSYTCGYLEPYDSFELRITRPGCEFNDSVGAYSEEMDDLLPTWFEHSAVSGYGDMRSLETKVDSDVRHAREIPPSEFEVKPELLKEIQDLWGKHFLPRKVRAEPYRIHLYGPGGLVGTFLAGLGDTSTSGGNFCIGDKTLRAKRRSWVAFHPDIPHEVTKLEDGYRAVIAFKMFREDNNEPDVLPAQLEARVKKILDQIPAPFGLLTAHQYSIGTTTPNGLDTLILAYARSRNDTQAHMLPVVTQFSGEAFDTPEDGENTSTSSVYPFTRAHVDILLERNVQQAEKEVQWLDQLSGIPFYSWNVDSLEIWHKDHPPGLDYTGNEASSEREDSIYLSHAILFLPNSQ